METRYKACYMGELAELVGCPDVETFREWLTPSDMKALIDLGWDPFSRLLKPPVVRYLREIKVENRYATCYMGSLAKLSGCDDLRTFQDWLTPTDLKVLVEMGWDPFSRRLKPPAVKYLREKYIDRFLPEPTNETP